MYNLKSVIIKHVTYKKPVFCCLQNCVLYICLQNDSLNKLVCINSIGIK